MKATPLKRCSTPRYPTRLEIDADPELLRRHLPAGWAASPKLASAAALLLSLAVSSCKTTPTAGPTPPPSAAGAKPTLAAEAGNGRAIVAPLFNHGEGRGWFGCFAVNAIAYLTEEEAWRVIDDELGKRGIKLTEKNVLIPGVEIGPNETFYRGTPTPTGGKPETSPPVAESGPPLRLRADRADSQRRILVEFVSLDNPPEKSPTEVPVEKPMEKSGDGIEEEVVVLSYSADDFKGKADDLRRKVAARATDRIYFAALYDPYDSVDRTTSTLAGKRIKPAAGSRNSPRRIGPTKPEPPPSEPLSPAVPAESDSKVLLRQQVRDFIDWLQAQGAI